MDNVDSLDMSGNLTVTAICAYWKSCPGDDTPFVVSLFREGFPLDFGMWLGDVCLFIHKNISEVKQRSWWEGLACSWHQFTTKVFSRVDVRFLSRPHVLPHQHWYTIIGFMHSIFFWNRFGAPYFQKREMFHAIDLSQLSTLNLDEIGECSYICVIFRCLNTFGHVV